MKKIALASAILTCLVVTPYAGAQQSETRSPYAIEDCKAGCYRVEQHSGATPIYVGAVPRTFRICSADAFGGTIIVDGKSLEISGTSFGVRSCQDVNALKIELAKGTVAVGALP